MRGGYGIPLKSINVIGYCSIVVIGAGSFR